ncbi:MAG: hypothetical protein ACK4GN_01640 [Runella sp.]
MQFLVAFLVCIFLYVEGIAQSSSLPVAAYEKEGRFLALDVYRWGSVVRHRYYVGDELVFRQKGKRRKFREQIVAITDSSFSYSRYSEGLGEYVYTEVPLSSVRKVQISRRIPWVTQGAYMLPVAGGIFLLSDTFIYRGGVDFKVQFDPKSALIGGGIATLGALCYKASYPSYRLKRHRLHTLRFQ